VGYETELLPSSGRGLLGALAVAMMICPAILPAEAHDFRAAVGRLSRFAIAIKDLASGT